MSPGGGHVVLDRVVLAPAPATAPPQQPHSHSSLVFTKTCQYCPRVTTVCLESFWKGEGKGVKNGQKQIWYGEARIWMSNACLSWTFLLTDRSQAPLAYLYYV